MAKFIVGIAAIVALGYLGGFIAWWGIALVAGIVGFVLQMHGALSFFSGLLGGGTFFGIYAYFLNTANDSILYNKMLLLFDSLPLEPFKLTILIGALLGALGMLTGKFLRDMLFGESKANKYRGRYR